MSADVAARLRTLAQDYQEGRIDLAAYRSLRAPLLDSLVSNAPAAQAMEITQPRAAVNPQREAITRPGNPRRTPEEAVGPRGNAAGSTFGVAALVMGVLVVAAIAFWLWRTTNTPTAGATRREPERAQDLVQQFIGRSDWSDASLVSLNAALTRLGGEQLAAVARETWFQRFVDEIRRRLKEQQALATTTLTAQNNTLAALAVTVGLDLNSPDAAIHIAAVPPPPPPGPQPEMRRAKPMPSASAEAPVVPTSRPASASDASAAAPSAAPTSKAAALPEPVAALAPATAPASPATHSDEEGCRVELIHSRRPLCHDSLAAAGEGPVMALVPAGAFDMGSTASAEEQPVHHVTLSAPFAISVYEVSQGEFKQYCEATHRSCPAQPWAGDDYPVVNVSWDDARVYVEWLSSVTHHHYSLPTEAQWEYAARAGQTGLLPSGSTLSPTDAYYSMLTKQTVAARRSQKFNANAFRLVHVVGNVREWVEDAWVQNFSGAPNDGSAVKSAHAEMRVARGGSYVDGSARLRLSMREGLASGTRDTRTGFRIARELP
jgi:formylglycine-generating enzyme required for sulfatase activity